MALFKRTFKNPASLFRLSFFKIYSMFEDKKKPKVISYRHNLSYLELQLSIIFLIDESID